MGRPTKKDQSDVKLQVRVPRALYDELFEVADELGFDSVPAYVRFWAAAETREHKLSNNKNLAKPSAQAVRYVELLLATKDDEPASLELALRYVSAQLKRQQSLKYLDKLVRREPLY